MCASVRKAPLHLYHSKSEPCVVMCKLHSHSPIPLGPFGHLCALCLSPRSQVSEAWAVRAPRVSLLRARRVAPPTDGVGVRRSAKCLAHMALDYPSFPMALTADEA